LIFSAVQILLITVQMPRIYSRDQLLSLRVSATLLNHDQRLTVTELGLRRRGYRAGNHTRRSLLAARSVTSCTCSTSTRGEIPVITGHRSLFTNNDQLSCCRRMLTTVNTSEPAVKRDEKPSTPSLYVLNAAAITKPHAVEHLAADLRGYDVEVAVITETHLKKEARKPPFLCRWVCSVSSRPPRASRRRGRSVRE